MALICCFGEFLFRFSPRLQGEWIRQSYMPVYLGGAELNVATALNNWQLPVRYSTVLPQNSLADEVIEHLRTQGIDPSGILRGGNRIGSYYLPQGTDLKGAGVFYDRAYSSFSSLASGTVDWKAILQNVSWLHLSAISPALNQGVADACKELLREASALGIPISIDLNYRARLWKYGVPPTDVMPGLVQYCDVVMGNLWAASTLLGIPVDPSLSEKSQQPEYLEHARTTAQALRDQAPRCHTVANTFRFDTPDGMEYYATLDTADGQVVSPVFYPQTVVDRVGTGDCFMAGLIYGLSQRHSLQDTVDFAAAAAVGKFSEPGDATRQTVADVHRTLQETRQRA